MPKHPVFENTDDIRGMTALMGYFCEMMRVRGLSDYTIHRRGHVLRNLAVWCEARGITRPQDVTKPILERYQRYLFHYRTNKGIPLGLRTQYIYFSAIQSFFRFLTQENHLLANPASDLVLPRYGRKLPKYVMTVSEVEEVLKQPDIQDPLGLRDRAIMETFYSTGIRRSELIRLNIYDVDMAREVLIVHQGKGNKDRVIPIGSRALAWIRKYLEEIRPELVVEPDHGSLFVTHRGKAISPDRLTRMVGRCITGANIGKKGSCHLFRHTMATLMLEGGADIRYVQQMLGHSMLETTSIYTHVSIQKLKEIFLATHPGAKLKKSKGEKDNPEV